MNFDGLVENAKFAEVEEAIAYEFGYFLEFSKDLAIVNGDSNLIEMQFERTKAEIQRVKVENLKNYEISNGKTVFETKGSIFKFDLLLPKEFYYSLEMTILLLRKLGMELDTTFSKFRIPPGRNSIFKGIKTLL